MATSRWIPVIAGGALQLCLGVPYIWSLFGPHVNEALAWHNKGSSLAFSLLIATLAFGGTLGGLLSKKIGLRITMYIGGGLMSLGFLLSAFAQPATPWTMWLTYGIMSGFGMGMCYTLLIATCQAWFPDNRGLVTGILVSCLGISGVLFTPIVEILIKQVGVMATFGWISLIFAVMSLICIPFINAPPADYLPKGYTPSNKKVGQDFTLSQMVRTPQFYLITLSFLLAATAGQMVISKAKSIAEFSLPMDAKTYAAMAVMIISIFNALGRLTWGGVSDKLGRKPTLMILMSLAGVCILGMNFATSWFVLVLIALIGFSYGGFLGVYPSLTADYYGVKNNSSNYGLVMIGLGGSSILAASIVGYFLDRHADKTIAEALNTPFIIAAIASALGLILLMLLQKPKQV